MASDSLNENETTLVIHIKDINDMPPVFGNALYGAEIAEEFPGSYPMLLMKV